MIELRKEYIVNGHRKDVYQFIADPANDKVWMSTCDEVNKIKDNLYQIVFKFFGKTLTVEMEYDSSTNKYHKFSTTKGPLHFQGMYEFHDHPEGVKIIWTFYADPKGFFGLVPNGVLKKALDKQADKDIKTLQSRFSLEQV